MWKKVDSRKTGTISANILEQLAILVPRPPTNSSAALSGDVNCASLQSLEQLCSGGPLRNIGLLLDGELSRSDPVLLVWAQSIQADSVS